MELSLGDISELQEILEDKNIKLAAAESLTAGLIQAKLGALSGVSKVFSGGVVAYNIDIKCNILNVNRLHAEECNCVSNTVAIQMAEGVSKLFKSDAYIATTGYAESYPSEGVENAHAYVCVGFNNYFSTFRVEAEEEMDRNSFRDFVANYAILALLKELRAVYNDKN